MEKEVTELAREYFQLSAVLPITDENFLHRILAEKINVLIGSDFNQLVYLLYRADVDEQRLKTILKSNPDTNAGVIIATLVMERLQQKVLSKKQYSNKPPDNINDDERW